MSRRHVPHAFTAVHTQPQPTELVEVLKCLAAEPFYGAYKQRLRDLLQARPGGRFLDVGAGSGDGALALTAECGARVVGADNSLTMAAAMKGAGLAHITVADGRCLPFQDSCFDGAWADRVLQHVEDGPGR